MNKLSVRMSSIWENRAVANNSKTNYVKPPKAVRKTRKAGEVKVFRPDADGNLRVGTPTPLTEQQKEARAEYKNPKSQYGWW